MSRARKIYNYTLDELYDIMYNSSLIYISHAAQRRVQKELGYLAAQRLKALDKYIGKSKEQTPMHKISKDNRSRLQYIQSLINGWLTESVVREAILKKIYGRKNVRRVVKRYSVINYPFIDKADCIIDKSPKNPKYIVEIKASMNLHGMSISEGGRQSHVFGFKVNSAQLLRKEAKRTHAEIIIIWYIIKYGIFYIQSPEEFTEMTNSNVDNHTVSQKDWGKECYIFNIPSRREWRSVKELWNTK